VERRLSSCELPTSGRTTNTQATNVESPRAPSDWLQLKSDRNSAGSGSRSHGTISSRAGAEPALRE
jgi:hypothetical protein